MSERIKGLILDVDGVMADTRPLNWAYYSEILDQAGYDIKPSPEDVTECFHMSKPDALKALAGLNEDDPSAQTELDNLLKIARKTERDPSLIKIPEGLQDSLFRLREKVNLSIATNAYLETPLEIFRRIKLSEESIGILFGAIVTAEDGLPLKPHPDMLYRCMEEMHTESSSTAFVGDSYTDIQAGKAADITTIHMARPNQQAIQEAEEHVSDLSGLNVVVRKLVKCVYCPETLAPAHQP